MAMFEVPADAYVRFMGRFSRPLAPAFADVGLEGVDADARVLDVGSGPGILTAELVRRRGEATVSACDPAAPFVEATAATFPLADVRQASAEDLPFADDSFGAALAQLVVHFMDDPVAGLREMARVTAPGGRVSACVWDHGGGTGPLSGFWQVVQLADPGEVGERDLPGSVSGDLPDLFERAGLREVRESLLTVTVRFDSFQEWWEPFTYGVGPGRAYVASLNQISRAGLADALHEEYGDGPFEIEAGAWTATGRV
jgi:SAM-dependent methyltransferase